MGSNARTFIALIFGHLYFSTRLQPPVNLDLQYNWKVALIQAILRGNDIHDDIFQGSAVDVAVGDAIKIAGDECFVDKTEQQYDIVGTNRLEQLYLRDFMLKRTAVMLLLPVVDPCYSLSTKMGHP